MTGIRFGRELTLPLFFFVAGQEFSIMEVD